MEVSQNDEICIKNDDLCIKNEEFCIKDDEFCSPRRRMMASLTLTLMNYVSGARGGAAVGLLSQPMRSATSCSKWWSFYCKWWVLNSKWWTLFCIRRWRSRGMRIAIQNTNATFVEKRTDYFANGGTDCVGCGCVTLVQRCVIRWPKSACLCIDEEILQ